ncbi:hypothetical protein [Microbaculum sp. FT89]|uniref:hypothetical protein n=1 Tax=Microbaculum sp. FT89 TaxID=3447298 RepID=UPI003F53657E
MNRILAFGLFTLVFIGALPLAAAQAQNCALPADYHADTPPDGAGAPIVITVGILVSDVTAIDDVGQSLEGDFILRKTWRDPRLARLGGCRLHRSLVWFPVTDVLNSNQLRRSRGEFGADQVHIQSGGVVEYYQRFFGSVATYHNLRDFPFDSHRMRIRIAILEYPADRVRIRLDPQFGGLAALLNIPDWSINGVETTVAEEIVPEFNTTYSVLYVDILASRNGQYFVWKVMLPLLLIVLMSFAVFWIEPERFGPQIGLAATSMLTLIAFQFAMTSMLPKLSYFTLLDQLILGSTILVFGSLVEATMTSVLIVKGKTESALRLDHVCRWLFPTALVAIWTFILI